MHMYLIFLHLKLSLKDDVLRVEDGKAEKQDRHGDVERVRRGQARHQPVEAAAGPLAGEHHHAGEVSHAAHTAQHHLGIRYR